MILTAQKALLVSSAVMGLSVAMLGTTAHAQTPVDFDCAATVAQILPPDSVSGAGLASEPALFVIPDSNDREWRDPSRPISIIENQADAVARGDVPMVNDLGVVGCAFIAAIFQDHSRALPRIVSENSNYRRGTAGNEYVPILLLRAFPGATGATDNAEAFQAWQQEQFAIRFTTTDHPETPSNDETAYRPSRAGEAIYVGPHLFSQIAFLGTPPSGWVGEESRPSLDHYVLRQISDAAVDDFRAILQTRGQRAMIDHAIVICAGATCGEIREMVAAQQAGGATDPGSPIRTTTLPTAGDTAQGSSIGFTPNTAAETPRFTASDPTTDPEPEPQPQPRPDTELADTALTDTPLSDIGPDPSVQGDSASPTPPSAIRVSIDGDDPLEASPTALACLLSSLGANIDLTGQAPCDAGLRATYSTWELTIDGPLDWSLRPPVPVAIRELAVTLPPNVAGDECVLDAFIQIGNDIVAELILEQDRTVPPPGAIFRADWPATIPNDLPSVTVILRPLNAAGCGGSQRSVTLPAAEILTLAMVDGARDVVETIHLSAFLSDDLLTELSLDTELQDQLTRDLLTASSLAFVQLYQSQPEAAFTFSRATFGRINRTGQAQAVALVPSVFEDGTTAVATVLSREELVGLEHTALTTPGQLRRILQSLSEDAITRGATQLRVAVLGPIAPRATTQPEDICNNPWLISETSDLDTGLDLTVSAYPIIPMAPEAAYPLDELVPLSLPTGAEQLPSGLMRCTSTRPGLEVFPYFNEPWRSARDLPARYSLAVGNHQAQALITAVRELED